jgi:hypothetical protein
MVTLFFTSEKMKGHEVFLSQIALTTQILSGELVTVMFSRCRHDNEIVCPQIAGPVSDVYSPACPGKP